MSAQDIISRLQDTPGRTDKEQIVFDAFMRGEREFFLGAKLAYDKLISFGVKKIPEIVEDDGTPGTFTFDEFMTLAGKLQRRELTGNAAQDALRNAAEQCDAEIWNGFYRRVLRKDFKCGITDSTINKVLKKVEKAHPIARDYIIPVFSCQLAHDGTDEVHAKKIRGRKLIDVKLDGVRLLTVLDKEAGTVTQYTRDGNINESFTALRECLQGLLERLPGSIVLDGEVVASSFQDLMTMLNRRVGKDTSKAKLALFDIIPLADFKTGECSTPLEDRHAILTALSESGALQECCGGSVYVIPKIDLDLDTPEGQEAFRQFNFDALAAGYEGIMVKDPRSPYRCKRTAAWLKIKPTISVSLAIVDVEEGKPDGKYVGKMGALVCEGRDIGKDIRVNVGSGFSDEQRVDFWARKNELIGMIVEIEADAPTMADSGTKWSLRFPRLKGFRGTKPGEKL